MTRAGWLILGLVFFLGSCGSRRVETDPTLESLYDRAQQAYQRGDCNRAVQLLERVTVDFPGSAVEDQARFLLADCYDQLGESEKAAEAFQRLAFDFPQSPYADDALFRAGRAYARRSERPELDQTETRKAIEAYETLISSYPRSSLIPDAREGLRAMRETLARKGFLNAKFYYDLDEYKAANIYFRQLIADFPQSEYAPEAYYYLYYTLRKLKESEGAERFGRALLELFPDSPAARRLAEEVPQLINMAASHESRAATP